MFWHEETYGEFKELPDFKKNYFELKITGEFKKKKKCCKKYKKGKRCKNCPKLH